MIDPPPPTKPKNSTIWWIVGAACAVFFTLGVGVAVLGYVVFTRLNPPPLNSKRPELVTQYPDGWSKYRYHDLGVEIEAPGSPRVLAFEPSRWPIASKMNVETYGGYDYSGGEDSGGVYSFVYRQGGMDEKYKKFVIDNLREQEGMHAGYHVRKTDVKDKVVDGVPCTEMTFYVDYGTTPFVHRSLIIMGARSYRAIDLSWWQDHGKAGEEDYDRLFKSIRFLPNEPGGQPWQTGLNR